MHACGQGSSGYGKQQLSTPQHPLPLCYFAVPPEQQRPRASTALEEVREEERAPAPPKFQPFLQQDPAPQTFGSSMLQSMTWGEEARPTVVPGTCCCTCGGVTSTAASGAKHRLEARILGKRCAKTRMRSFFVFFSPPGGLRWFQS